MGLQPFAAAAERGLVKLVAGHWVKDFLDEAELFPYGNHDDQMDAASLAFNKLAVKRQLWVRYDGSTTSASTGDKGDGKPRIIAPEEMDEWIKSVLAAAPKEEERVGVRIPLRADAEGWDNIAGGRRFGRRFG